MIRWHLRRILISIQADLLKWRKAWREVVSKEFRR